MGQIKTIFRKIKSGMLREVLNEIVWIYRYGLKYKKSVFWYIFLGMIATLLGLISSVISKYLIDAVIGYNSSKLLPAAISYVFFELFVIGSRAWSNIISTKIEIKVNHEIRADIYDKIMDADWEALTQFHSGDLLNRVDNDVSSVSASVIGWIPDFITRSFQFLGTLGVILYFDSTLALLALLSAPVTFIVARTVSARIRNYSQNIKKISSDVMIFNEESFQNIQLIKSFGLSDSYKKKLRDVQDTYKTTRLHYNKFSVLSNSILSVTGSIVAMTCFGWSIYRLWTGNITYGTMTLFLQLSSSLALSFTSLVHLVPGAISAATAAGRLMAITGIKDEKHLEKDSIRNVLQNKQPVCVEAKQITFHYSDGTKVLENADFKANPGEIIALVGPSGEGKTTILRILLGLVSVSTGSVTVNNIPISAASRKLFSYVPQENIMFAGSVAENLRLLNPEATEDELNSALHKACAYDFVYNNPSGLQSPIKENGGGFSEGQIQRLAIARALLSNAPVILLDEATSALDVTTERKILRNILQDTGNKTCIITTHRPSALNMCDRIYRISNCNIEVMHEDDVAKMIMDF